MFGSRVKDLKEEIKFLREENKELRLQLVAMAGKSSEYWNTKLADKKKVVEPKGEADVVKSIMKVVPKNEEERLQQERAKKYASRILRGC